MEATTAEPADATAADSSRGELPHGSLKLLEQLEQDSVGKLCLRLSIIDYESHHFGQAPYNFYTGLYSKNLRH